MNNTKWDEIFKEFYHHLNRPDVDDGEPIFFKIIPIDFSDGYSDLWDSDWSHFGTLFKFYKEIEYLQIKCDTKIRPFVLDVLHTIHVPGKVEGEIVTVFGYNTECDFL